MLQNVHRKSCSIQIFRPHCTFCSYCGDTPIKGEFLPKSKQLYNVCLVVYCTSLRSYHPEALDDSTRNHFFKSLSGREC